MPPANSPSGAAPPPKPDKPRFPSFKGGSWDRVKERANTIARIAALFVFLVGSGATIGFFYSQSRKPTPTTKSPTIQTLSKEDLEKLNEIGANLGTTGQTLNIGANALFRGKADVTGDLTIGGRLNANGPVVLSQLNITGSTAATGLSVGSNLIVGGDTTLQKSLSVGGLTSINSNLNVTGQVSANSLTTNNLTVRNISISGPLTVAYLSTTGPTPFFAAGAVGSGGTVSISGNDTAGTININTGTSPTAGVTLMTITFRAAFSGTPHVLITPRTAAAAGADAYIAPATTNFRVLANNPPAGQTLTYDYLVVQ